MTRHTAVNAPHPDRIRIRASKLAFGLLLMTVTVPAIAQEIVSQNVSRDLLQLGLDKKGDDVAVIELRFSPDGKYQDDQRRECTRVKVLQHSTEVTSVALALNGRSRVTGDSRWPAISSRDAVNNKTRQPECAPNG